MKYYTGIGSRSTPLDIQTLMTKIAIALAKDNWILRSGGAEGADGAFEAGALYKRIYLPWDGFNNKMVDNYSYVVPPYEEEMVYDYHPSPNNLSRAGLKLMSRNSYQVLGDDLDSASAFLVCWTSGGKLSGGTAQALRIASDYKVPIYNLFYEDQITALCNRFELQLA
jgi:hypothetical protein